MKNTEEIQKKNFKTMQSRGYRKSGTVWSRISHDKKQVEVVTFWDDDLYDIAREKVQRGIPLQIEFGSD